MRLNIDEFRELLECTKIQIDMIAPYSTMSEINLLYNRDDHIKIGDIYILLYPNGHLDIHKNKGEVKHNTLFHDQNSMDEDVWVLGDYSIETYSRFEPRILSYRKLHQRFSIYSSIDESPIMTPNIQMPPPSNSNKKVPRTVRKNLIYCLTDVFCDYLQNNEYRAKNEEILLKIFGLSNLDIILKNPMYENNPVFGYGYGYEIRHLSDGDVIMPISPVVSIENGQPILDFHSFFINDSPVIYRTIQSDNEFIAYKKAKKYLNEHNS